jgi:hypothetical protein
MKTARFIFLAAAFVCGALTAFAQTWKQTSAPKLDWYVVASSADGAKLVADVGVDGGIYSSTNSGASWAATSAPTNFWEGLASSADGVKLVASIEYGGIYTSTNSGLTWMQQTNAPNVNWGVLVSSADGTKLAAEAGMNYDEFGGPIYVSTNSGITWTVTTETNQWYSLASSADGTTLAAIGEPADWPENSRLVYISKNSGATWGLPNLLGSIFSGSEWSSVACSADGTKLIVGNEGRVFISTNSGATWISNSIASTNMQDWNSVAISADGSKMTAIVVWESGSALASIYSSRDSGVTWQSNNAPGVAWEWIASSADGAKSFATVGAGGIYTSQTISQPRLNLTPSSTNLMLDWGIPSTNFVLQQISGLSTAGWSNVTNTPVLNLTNLQNQVTLPAPASNAFFRLKTP